MPWRFVAYIDKVGMIFGVTKGYIIRTDDSYLQYFYNLELGVHDERVLPRQDQSRGASLQPRARSHPAHHATSARLQGGGVT